MEVVPLHTSIILDILVVFTLKSKRMLGNLLKVVVCQQSIKEYMLLPILMEV